MKITVLTGGVGGAKFLLGVKSALGMDPYGDAQPEGAKHQITAIVNTADDITLHGLRICPDLDSCLYTLAGVSDQSRGWGRADETWTVSKELAAYGAEAPWFSLGDKDIATHLFRTSMLNEGRPLSEIVSTLVRKWRPGVRLLPMTDEQVETYVEVDDPTPARQTSTPDDAGSASPALRLSMHFQEWWTRYRATLAPYSITPDGAPTAKPAPGVLDAIGAADVVLIAPSNPVVSIGTILSVPGIRSAVRTTTAPVIGVSPIINGKPVRGHADACLATINVACSAEGVGKHYGARAHDGLLDGFLVALGDEFELAGAQVASAPLLMSDPETTARMVQRCLELADVAR
ncbi:2-phospho-L-lactate transferase [Micrococcaceae bacterium Sec5.1]